LERFRTEQGKELERLRQSQAVELEKLRHEFAKLSSRLERIHGKEFDVLPELWKRLQACGRPH